MVVWTGVVEGGTVHIIISSTCMLISGATMDLSPGVDCEVIRAAETSVMASDSAAVEK